MYPFLFQPNLHTIVWGGNKIRPYNKESEEPTQAQDQPSFSNQASPPTQDEDQAQENEVEDQEDEPPQEEDIDQGGDEDNNDKEDEQEIQGQILPHPRVQAIQRAHPVNSILGDIHKGVTTRSRVAHFCEHYSFVSSIEHLEIRTGWWQCTTLINSI